MRLISVEQRRARLARRHRLTPAAKTNDVAATARDLVGLHATDPASIFLGATARMKRPSIDAVVSALYDDRTVLRMLGMRRTLFVESVDLAPVVQSAASNAVAARERTRLHGFLRDAGIADDPGPWLRDVERKALKALASLGEATAAELSAAVPELKEQLLLSRGKKYEATVSISGRVLLVLAAEGHVVRGRPRGSWISTQYRWTAAEAWLGSPIPSMPLEEARAELVRCWLRTFGPGTVDDLKWWTGWGAGEVGKALAAVQPVEVELGEAGPGLVLADDVESVRAPRPWVALLPALDATTMGWRHRDWYLGEHSPLLFDRMGNAGPTVWCDGRVVGGWAQRRDGDIAYRVLDDVGSEAMAAVDAAADQVHRLVGDIRYTTRFPTPLERELRG